MDRLTNKWTALLTNGWTIKLMKQANGQTDKLMDNNVKSQYFIYFSLASVNVFIAAVVGGCVGVLLMSIIIIIITCYYCYQRKKKGKYYCVCLSYH